MLIGIVAQSLMYFDDKWFAGSSCVAEKSALTRKKTVAVYFHAVSLLISKKGLFTQEHEVPKCAAPTTRGLSAGASNAEGSNAGWVNWACENQITLRKN